MKRVFVSRATFATRCASRAVMASGLSQNTGTPFRNGCSAYFHCSPLPSSIKRTASTPSHASSGVEATRGMLQISASCFAAAVSGSHTETTRAPSRRRFERTNTPFQVFDFSSSQPLNVVANAVP